MGVRQRLHGTAWAPHIFGLESYGRPGNSIHHRPKLALLASTWEVELH